MKKWIFIAVCCCIGMQTYAQNTPGIVGKWLGTLDVGSKLRVVFTITTAGDSLITTLDIPDQGVENIPTVFTTLQDAQITIDMSNLAAKFIGTFVPDSNMISGVWIQGAPVPLVLRKTDKVERISKPQEPVGPLPYTSTEVTFGTSDLILSGTLTIPPGEGPFPAVVLVSGSGPQDRDESLLGHKPFLVLSDHLTRQGIIVLRYDDRGTGASGGNFASATTYDFADDALSAVAYLKLRKDLPISKIGIVGHSEGGMVAPIAATKSKQVDFIVLMAGLGIPGDSLLLLQGDLISRASGIPEDMFTASHSMRSSLIAICKEEEVRGVREKKLHEFIVGYLSQTPPELLNALGIRESDTLAITEAFSSDWMHTFLAYDPKPVLKKVRVPVLAVNGTKDLQVPATENLKGIERALSAGKCKSYTIQSFENLNHLFQTTETGNPSEYGSLPETFNVQVMETIATWILEL